jgi:hypothetical protein
MRIARKIRLNWLGQQAAAKAAKAAPPVARAIPVTTVAPVASTPERVRESREAQTQHSCHQMQSSGDPGSSDALQR